MKQTTLRSLDGQADLPSFLSRTRRTPLGQLLVASGALSAGARREILDRQARFDARFGEILLARDLIDRDRLFAAIARQFDAERADFAATPPALELAGLLGAERCLQLGLLPWKRDGDRVVVATCRPDEFDRHRPMLLHLLGPVRMAVAGELELHDALVALAPHSLIHRAETRVVPEESCRTMRFNLFALPPLVLLALALALLTAILWPVAVMRGVTSWAILTLVANSALKLAALVQQMRAPPAAAPDDPARPILARLPRVSILVALYKEREIAARLIRRLDRIDYPRELLEICLVVEEDDQITRTALTEIEMPHHMRIIVVPEGQLKTKPRALNYALDFCRGALIGVYDAEDAPAPDQILRVVRRFHERGPDLGCVQAVLDFYNSRSNWLARCFAVEYAAWFRVVLPGMTRLGLVAPLGGTSLFFRRAVLEDLGGWDAHNVTEDADLGVRLARHGYRTEFIDSVTAEEANCRTWPWIKQRSRWLKGYMMTWAVHMRRPGLLLQQLGPWRFAGVQLLFLGTLSQFLLAPVLWIFWLVPFGYPHPFAPALGLIGTWGLLGVFVLSELINVAVGLYATRDKAHRHLMPWVVTLHFYFPLAALAAYRGLFGLLSRPFYWDKTTHGIFTDPDEPEAEPARPSPLPRFLRRRA